MELLGRVNHGVIVPDGNGSLPEGAVVRIVYEPENPGPTGSSLLRRLWGRFRRTDSLRQINRRLATEDPAVTLRKAEENCIRLTGSPRP